MDRISPIVLFATVAMAPFPFGSTEPTAIAFWCIVLGVGVVAASPKKVRKKHLALVALLMIVISGFALIIHEQVAVHPWIASPNELWQLEANALGVPIESVVSVARNQPLFSMGAPLANILALICSFIVCTDRERAHQLLRVVAWSGVAYAIYGIIAYVIDPDHILWREKSAYRDVLTSTFVNRNTAATYFGSCAVIWLLFLAKEFRGGAPSVWFSWQRVLPQRLFSRVPQSIVVSLTMLAVCLVALLVTNSRAGVALSVAALVMAFVVFFRRDISTRWGIGATIIISSAAALLFVQVFGGRVTGRFDLEGLSDEGRLDVYRSVLKMIAEHPWFGTGLGTFAWIFPTYRGANISMWGIWDRAHSTPLELASELGIPMAGLISFAWLVILGVLVQGIARRRRDVILPIAAFTIAMLGLCHSLIDFPLQIPGYAIVVFAIVGAGLAQSFPGDSA